MPCSVITEPDYSSCLIDHYHTGSGPPLKIKAPARHYHQKITSPWTSIKPEEKLLAVFGKIRVAFNVSGLFQESFQIMWARVSLVGVKHWTSQFVQCTVNHLDKHLFGLTGGWNGRFSEIQVLCVCLCTVTRRHGNLAMSNFQLDHGQIFVKFRSEVTRPSCRCAGLWLGDSNSSAIKASSVSHSVSVTHAVLYLQAMVVFGMEY